MASSPAAALVTDLETAPLPCRLGDSLSGPQSCQCHLPAHDLSLAPLSHDLGSALPTQGPRRTHTPLYPLRQTCWPWAWTWTPKELCNLVQAKPHHSLGPVYQPRNLSSDPTADSEVDFCPSTSPPDQGPEGSPALLGTRQDPQPGTRPSNCGPCSSHITGL